MSCTNFPLAPSQGNVETWLGDLLRLTLSSIHSVIRTASIAIQDPAFKLLEFENMFPSQVGLLGIQMIWTRDSEIALTQARTDKKVRILSIRWIYSYGITRAYSVEVEVEFECMGLTEP